ncbi:MAG: DUF1318 domain-containing protein [Alphaproteobacteria bacterium]
MKNSKTAWLVAFISVFSASCLLSACSHELKLVGDKDKPVSINAEIKIHIYQHAADNVDAMMEGLDDEIETPEKTSFVFKKFIYALADLGVSTAYAAETKKSQTALSKSIEQYRKAYPFLKKQILGENRDGYVAVINKSKNAADADIKQAAKIADKLNAARKALYQSDAKSKNVSVREIQTMYAKAFRKKSKKGTWTEVQKDGKWSWKQK